MSDNQTVEPAATKQPTTKQKVTLTIAQMAVGLAVTAAGAYVSDRINKKVETLIIPQ